MLASAPYALLFWISRVICPTALHASVYLKANKDYNNEFSEDGKILKVGRSPEVSWRQSHLAPLTAFFSRGGNILFQISGGGGRLRGGAYAPPVLKQGMHCICTLCPTVPHATGQLRFIISVIFYIWIFIWSHFLRLILTLVFLFFFYSCRVNEV